MDKYLPSIISLIGVMLTVGVSLWLGIAKQKTENKTVSKNVEGDLRDDLLALIDHHEKQLEQKEEQIRLRDERIEKKDAQLQAAQTVIASQLENITDLNLTVKQQTYELSQLQSELDKFNKKVFYKKPLEDSK